jgi:hypothetical protein
MGVILTPPGAMSPVVTSTLPRPTAARGGILDKAAAHGAARIPRAICSVVSGRTGRAPADPRASGLVPLACSCRCRCRLFLLLLLPPPPPPPPPPRLQSWSRSAALQWLWWCADELGISGDFDSRDKPSVVGWEEWQATQADAWTSLHDPLVHLDLAAPPLISTMALDPAVRMAADVSIFD